MTLRLRAGGGLLLTALAATCGCGVQDRDQPAVGSISVKADKSDDAPIKAPARTPAGRPK